MDALVALSQRTVFVATWPGAEEGLRTIVTSSGVSALPLFTDMDELLGAAPSLGWQSPDGSAQAREIGARAALSHALAHNLLVVVDIGAPHVMEADHEEIAPLLSPQARRDSSGPFAAAGRVSSSLMQAVKPGTPPRGMPVRPPSSPAGSRRGAARKASRAIFARPQDAPEGFTVSTPTGPAEPQSQSSATFGGGSTVRITALVTPPSEDLLDALCDVLRSYPEVEWACIAAVSRGPAPPVPTVGLRIDATFRSRVSEIVGGVRATASRAGAALDVLLLDDPVLVRVARNDSLLFYPWRR